MAVRHWRPAQLAVGLASGPVIAVSLTVVAVISLLLGIWLSMADATVAQVLASQMAFTPERFIDAIGPLGPDGIAELVRITITLGFAHSVAFAAAIGAVWARLAGPRAWTGWALPLAAALIAAASNWLENLFHLAAAAQMVRGTRPSTVLVASGSTLAAAKWALLVLALLSTARAALRRRGSVALVAIPITLLAGVVAAAPLAAAI